MNDQGGVKVTPVQVVAVILMIVTELANDAVIDGHTAKIITGLAGIIVPAVWMLADAWVHHAHARVLAADSLAASNNTPVTGVTVKS